MLDRAILIFISLMTIIIKGVSTDDVAAMLCAVIMTAVCAGNNERLSKAVCFTYAAAAIPFSSFLFFVPLSIYELFGKSRVWWFCAAPFLFGFHRADFSIWILFLMTACVIAICLKLNRQKMGKLEKSVRKTRDSGIENEMLLKKRNSLLMSRQDSEITLAMLDERNRISREIHDNVGHLLTRSLYQVSTMQVLHKEEPQVMEELSQLKDTLSDAMDSIRSSVHNLHDESVDLKLRLQRVIDDFKFCRVVFKYECGDMPKELKYCFTAIVQEALSNISKHSNATVAEVSVLEHPGFYQLIIQDNGTVKGKHSEDGMGIFSMRERIESFNGVFRVMDEKGFKIFSTVPKEGLQ